MRKRQLRNSELFISEIGFGCMSLPVHDERTSIHMIHEAIDRGVNFFDTADLYGQGKNEEIVGKALRGKRTKVILATKVGNRWESGKDGWYWGPTKNYILSQVKTSLARLQTDYIDLYQLHGGTLEDPIDEIIEAFEELKAKGTIREYGISSIRPKVVEQYVKRSNIVSVMSQYSILDRRPENEILPMLASANIGLIARGPIAKGILSQHAESKIPQNGYLNYTYDELLHLIIQLKSMTHTDKKLEHLALQFVLDNPTVITAIPGASTIEQLVTNMETVTKAKLSQDEIDTLKSISKVTTYS